MSTVLNAIEREKEWTEYGERHLVGRKIVKVCYLTKEEEEEACWYN